MSMSSRLSTRTLAAPRRATRRKVVGASIATAALAGLDAAAFARQDATPSTGWSFTDDLGVTIELDRMPERLAIDLNPAAALWDFGIRPGAIFGWNAVESGEFGEGGGSVDASQVQFVGNPSEPVQLEAMAAFDPDLIITISFDLDAKSYWSIDDEILPQVQGIAPVLALSATGDAKVNTDRHAELAAALGADLSTPELDDAAARYDAAIADLEAAAAEKADLNLLYVSVREDEFFVVNPALRDALSFYQSLGVAMVEPDIDPAEYWETLSLEEALKYPADIVFSSNRPGRLTSEELREHPTFGEHPAVKAEQNVGWAQDAVRSFQGMAADMEFLAATLRESVKVTEG